MREKLARPASRPWSKPKMSRRQKARRTDRRNDTRSPHEDHPLVGYYVDKYTRAEYGTPAQLQHRRRHQTINGGVSEEALTRLTRAWHAMKQHVGTVPEAYRIGGEWAPIVSHAFRALVRALDRADHASLRALLGGFFRHFGDYLGEPADSTAEPITRYRCDFFRVWASRWVDLYGEESLRDATVPVVGEPVGFVLNGDARRIEDLASDIASPVVCEIGGGFGGFAYHLLRRPSRPFTYLDYDIPVMSVIAAYFLLSTLPEKRVALFGEVEDLGDPLGNCDAAILPNFALPRLAPQYAHICFNSCSFAEMDKRTVEEYMRQVDRVCGLYLLHVNHSWTAESKNAYYSPLGGFRHWDVSSVEPSAARFKRLHRIPAPFLSDFYGEFFEWLYARTTGDVRTSRLPGD